MKLSTIVLFGAFIFIPLILVESDRSFIIDYDNNQFLKDGEPYRYISGSIHYFRVPRVHWQDRLNKMKAGGLNTIQTYVDWSQHEPEPGVYDFSDNLDIVTFITMANETGLNVILRPGPYICAERDFGGLPYWLYSENPKMVIRSSDPSYLKFVDKWFTKFFPLISPLIYANGGPVISVQVENEYGSYYTCDSNYTTHLRDLFRSLLGNDVILFTTDGAGVDYLKCGAIPDVYATVDFGPGTNIQDAFDTQRAYSPKGPNVNSEYYTGWLDHWGESHSTISSYAADTLDQILAYNASVNMYMYHGGTNFKFTNGANMGGSYEPDPTSYDYDGPISEAGDTTNSFYLLRDVIAKYAPVEDPIPQNLTKTALGPVPLSFVGTLFDVIDTLIPSPPITVDKPLTAAAYRQAYGFILYETTVTTDFNNAKLRADGIQDRGYVFVDQVPVGILDRASKTFAISVNISANQVLSIFVENQGRIGFGSDMTIEFKGIVGDVELGGTALETWTMYSVPLNNTSTLHKRLSNCQTNSVTATSNVPSFYTGNFVLAPDSNGPYDTFFDPTGWTKGVVFINGHNIGKYWPVKGPQITLFAPKNVFLPNPQTNTIVVFEQEGASVDLSVSFVNAPNINSPIQKTSNRVISNRDQMFKTNIESANDNY